MFFKHTNRYIKDAEYQAAIREIIQAAKVWKQKTQTTLQDGWWPVNNLRQAVERLEKLEKECQ